MKNVFHAKRWRTGLAGALIAVSLLGGPMAVQAKSAVHVSVDGKQVNFGQAPYTDQGVTMAEFRKAFQALGYTVSWDSATHTVHAEKTGTKIEFQPGAHTAVVNGRMVLLDHPVVEKNGVTFVPLRWIGETSGSRVDWEGATGTVAIETTEYQLDRVIRKDLHAMQNKDLETALALVDSQSPVYAQTKALFMQTFSSYDLTYQLKKEQLQGSAKGQAQVWVDVRTHKIKGGEAFKDNDTQEVIMFREVNGAWKIYQTVPLAIDYLNADQYPQGQIQIGEADKQAIQNVINQDAALLTKGDLNGAKALYASDYPNLGGAMNTMQSLLRTYKLDFEIGGLTLLQASENEAQVKYTITTSKVSGPAFTNSQVTEVDTLRKDDQGHWVIASQDDVLMIKYLYGQSAQWSQSVN